MRRLTTVLVLALFVLAIPAACAANDGFKVIFDLDKKSVTASGTDVHVITDKEREAFGITDGPLKSAVEKYFGKRPNDAYLHSPTPWGDLYKTYHWPQVQTTLKILKAEIVSTDTRPEIVKTATFENKSSRKATFHVTVSQQVTNTEEHTWSKSDTLTFSQSISYGVKIGGETSASYSHTWGESRTHSQSVTIGSEDGVTQELEPGDAVIASLTANRGTMKVRVTYLASLGGDVAVNYNPTYKGHHFWALGVTGVMQSGGLQWSKVITEDITIGFYADSKLEIKDAKGNMLHSMPARHKHH